MKQKNNSQTITEKSLQEKIDLLEIRFQKTFTTKQDLKDLEHRIEEMFTEFSSSIFTAIDPLVADLEARREDRAIAAEQVHQTREKLEDHQNAPVKKA